ncbi:lytic transglycosylase domain-containing protein [Rahnella sp. BCC 1045]|uniref:lytic transglycosylase domain-containing protein n=1 Tax=Rahnella sp. BCC 1045 TaxID=2816251 RepID=UPI001C267B79|nr:lytic transglycosylase domain-containing protein [Rahnella sp. BCC 1045]MBU9819677.1 lytic transglycosylase domain-containing protein [Rahnella sp. BCC 1045]
MQKNGFLAIVAGAFTCSLALSFPAQAFCFNEAGARYHVDPLLLRAITQVESSDNPHAINYNRNKKGKITSHDDGLMQINSTHLPELLSMGVLHSEQELLTNPCLNVQVGAWVLARHLQVCGVTWECLGSYNAGFADDNKEKRMLYARKVYAKYLVLRQS